LEGAPARVAGFGLLDFDTTLMPQKTLLNVSGRLGWGAGAAVAGYEIHMGETRGPALAAPALLLDGPQGTRPDGARSADGQILATYVHGVFERPDACAALLEWAGLDAAEAVDWAALREASIERLADTLGVHLDLDRTFGAFA
ncbi:cobyric acid synthase, partial [Burkholderia glumae]